MHKTFPPILCMFLLLFTHAAFPQNPRRSLNSEHWQFRNSKETKWYPATVPGTVHTDLLTNKLIDDPFYADNEQKLQWIENESWEYATTFSLSKKEIAFAHIELEFEGLDTYAKVYLNDSLLLSACNMFRKWKVDIKKHAHKGENKLRVVFEPAVAKEKKEAKKLTYTLPGDERVFSRKAPYQYGWDWGPRFVTCGIWKDVKLRFWNKAVIRNLNCVQKSLTDSLAQLSFVLDVDCDQEGIYSPTMIFTTSQYYDAGMYEKQPINAFLKKGSNRITVEYFIRKPQRWWCNGLGKPYHYLFTAYLDYKHEWIDQADVPVGLRTLELVQEKDKAGSSFYFKLNGVPVFMKGANYIPPDNFLPRVTSNKYEDIVKQAKDANMNMLRVWGGGVYADDAFYDACDQNGILVWQDFMFACAMYPGDEAFISNVKQEVIDNVNRLKHHPCLALWCGNNESDEGWKNWGWQKQYNYSKEDSAKIWKDYVRLFQDVIPKTLDSIVPGATYVSSSPQIGWGHKEGLQQGDSHYWGVWWGMEPFETYEKKVGRFMSEYGFQGMPDLSTFKKIAPDSALNLDSPAIKNHQKHPTGYATIQTYMERDYKVPKSFENYVYVSQLLQARGMKTAIEAHRRAKPYCMGTLYWQLNDCWPVTSWSSVDYYNKWKASHYQAKRSYEEVIISFEEKNDSVYVYLINDRQKDLEGSVSLSIALFSGPSYVVPVKQLQSEVKANSSTLLCIYPKTSYFRELDPKSYMLQAAFSCGNESFTGQHFFEKTKNLQLLKPSINYRWLNETTLEIQSDLFAKDVFLQMEGVQFPDNFFDLMPGEKKILSFPNKINSEGKPLMIKSLFDVNE